MVRLQPYSDIKTGLRQIDFNTIMVRLQLPFDDEVVGKQVNFNTIMVRLQPYHQRCPPDARGDFNTIMVRLQLRISEGLLRRTFIFQYHNGSIATFTHS